MSTWFICRTDRALQCGAMHRMGGCVYEEAGGTSVAKSNSPNLSSLFTTLIAIVKYIIRVIHFE